MTSVNLLTRLQFRNILHLFQCLPFCFTHGKPYKGKRDRCGYGVDGVSASQTDYSTSKLRSLSGYRKVSAYGKVLVCDPSCFHRLVDR